MEFPGSSVVIIRHRGEGDEKRGLHSTDLLQNTPLLSHVSIPFVFLTVGQDTLFLGLIYFFDQMLIFPLYGGGS